MRSFRATLVALLVLAAALIGAPAALAHARLEGTVPETGSTVKAQPREVIFKFDQPVGGTEGAVRVYDAEGKEVDNGEVEHPGGRGPWLGVGLEPGLPDGTYTATYRVISADTHIVYGGLVFNLGHASKGGGVSVAGLIGEDESGSVTKVAFGVVRFLDYLTIALMVGGLIFLAFAAGPALRELGDVRRRGAAGAAQGGRDDTGGRWAAAGAALRRRSVPLLAFAIVLGIVVSLLGILLQGASAAGVSLWSSLKWSIVDDTLGSRFGTVWLLRAIDWAALGVILLAWLKLPRARRWLAPLVALGCAYLVTTPAFAGHASIESPVAVMFPSDVIHVLASSVWVGGVAFLLLALPAATREVEPPDRTRLLLGTLARFSPIALASVVALAATGLAQAYIDVRRVADLVDTTYGLLVLAKMVLLVVLVGFGWVNKDRIIPRLRRLVEGAAAPGSTGALARRNLRGELATMLVVFGVTAALIAFTPPIDAAPGPFSTTTRLGPAEIQMSVEPAEVGLNTIHLSLIDAKTGAPFKGTKELTVAARLPSKGIGPLKLTVHAGGPGHYIVPGADLSPGGVWQLEVTDRVSAFDQFATKVSVPVE
jgi:copper transport protein